MRVHYWHFAPPAGSRLSDGEQLYECLECGIQVRSHITPAPSGRGLDGPLILVRGHPPRPVMSEAEADCNFELVRQVMQS